MRSDRNKATDSEREIEDFLSKFEPSADELSTDYSSYLNDNDNAASSAAQSFNWKKADEVSSAGSSGAAPFRNQIKKSSSSVSASYLEEDRPVVYHKAAKRAVIKETPADHKAHLAEEKKKEHISEAADIQPSENIKAEQPAASDKVQSEDNMTVLPAEAEQVQPSADNKAELPVEEETAGVSDKVISKAEAEEIEPDLQKTDAPSEEKSDAVHTEKIPSEKIDDSIESSPKASSENIAAALVKKVSEKEGSKAASEKLDRKERQRKVKEKKRAKALAEKEAAKSAPALQDVSSAAETPEKAAAEKKVNNKKKKKKKPKKSRRSLGQILFLKENKDYDPSLGETYEKDGKTVKNKQYKFSFLKLVRDFAVVGLICVLAGLTAATVMVMSAPKYDYKDVYAAVATSSSIYDDKGKQIDNVFYTENRKVVKYEDMPEVLINSFVAIEDKTFWKHHGFNWTRMIGAVLSSLTGNGRISGTSTITQQLARNVYLADTKSVRSIKRKILEMYYAARLEHALSKEEIIEAYLNTIYLGHGCYGINAAAKTYFSKKVKDLDLIECASLAALPQSPDTYALLKLASEAQDVKNSKVVATEPDTIVTNDLAKERRQLTLDLMLDQGYITKEEYEKVYDKDLNDFIKPKLNATTNVYSYFHEYLVDTVINDLMDQYNMSYEDAERMVYTKGLQIYSTVDSKAQKVVAKEFQEGSNFPYVTAPRDGEGNLLNNDGKVALYNYDNFFDGDGDFKLSGSNGDVKVNSDGSITIMKDHKLHIYETEVGENIDYSIEFKNYYVYDDNGILYSIQGGYLNVPSAYKSSDGNGNVIISADFFNDESYKGCLKKDGDDVIITEKIYTLSPKTRQPQGAMTIVGVGTGEVKAMVGGRQFGGQKLLNRSLNPRQPGSSIKPLAVYGAALQKSYELAEAGEKWKFTDFGIDKQGTKGWGDYVTVHSSIEDEKTKIEGKYWPNNVTRSFTGKNTFKTAIQKSINTCAVKLELQIGSDYSISQLKKFGITTVQDDTSLPVNDVNPAALALGAMTTGVKPLEMALAYASFPGGGKVNTPVCYYKVLDREGKTLLEGQSTQSEALNEGVAWIMTDVLRSVVRANSYMYVSDVQPGGKTGTTNDQYDIWFDGFTPSYAGSLWIGTDENVEMSSMSTTAAALWGKIIDQIPAAKKGAYSDQPSNVIEKYGEYFTKGTETGLTSWSSKEAREKAKKAAYNKWKREREKHKKYVKEKGHWEDVYETQKTKVKDAWDEEIPVYEEVEVDTGEVDEEGNPIYKTEKQQTGTKKVHHDAEYKTEKVKTGTKWVVDKKAHYEYEKGWRDGDFKYKG